MKKLSILMLTIVAFPSYGQSLMSTFSQYQSSLKAQASPGTPGSNPSEVKPSSQVESSSVKKCVGENDQTSMPLNYLTSLLLEQDAKLDLLHDPRAGTLTVTAPDMVGNCSSMLEWNMKRPPIQDKKAYALEVTFKKGVNCDDTGCEYEYARVEKGVFKQNEKQKFKPTLAGFEECMKKSGVIVDGKVVPESIYPLPVKERFTKVEESGQVLFLSHGPQTSLIKAKYGKFEYQDGCDYYEAAHPDIKSLLTYEDAERIRLQAEADKLKECKLDEYSKLVTFIEQHRDFADQLITKLNGDLAQIAKKSAENIEKGKYTDEDLKIIADFERYVVKPKVDEAIALYEQMEELEGDAKKAKQEELKKVLADLTAYRNKPYFVALHVNKLLADAKFEEAKTLNGLLLTLDSYKNLGSKQNNVVITPDVAKMKVIEGNRLFAEAVAEKMEEYEFKTGQQTGKADGYARLAKTLRKNIETRTKNYNQANMEEAATFMTPNGHCNKYWVNAQKCRAAAEETIKDNLAKLEFFNGVDAKRAAEYEALAKKWGDLEAEGRRYVAKQNGEEAPVEEPKKEEPEDTTTPSRTDPGIYTFDFNQQQQGQQGQMNPQMLAQYQQQMQMQQQGQAQMTPGMYQYPTNPFAQNNMFQQQNPFGYQQQSFLGQQAYPYNGMQAQGGYQFAWGGGAQQQQYGQYPQQQMPFGQYPLQQPNGFAPQQPMYPQQPGYWANPMQSQQYAYPSYGRF